MLDFITGSVVYTYVVTYGVKLLVTLLIWIVGKKLINVVLNMFNKAVEKGTFDKTIAGFIGVIIRYGLYVLLIVVMLNYLNIGTASLAALVASCGLALGLSLQGSVSNIAGSVMLLITKPFNVGDYIVTGQGEGVVKIVDLIYTTLVTVDKKEVHIPNGVLANSNITNLSTSPERGVSCKVGISYSSDIKKAKELIEKMMRESEYVIPGTDVTVFVSSLGESSVNLEGRCTVDGANYWPATWYFNETVKNIFDEENITIPFNQLDVHMK